MRLDPPEDTAAPDRTWVVEFDDGTVRRCEFSEDDLDRCGDDLSKIGAAVLDAVGVDSVSKYERIRRMGWLSGLLADDGRTVCPTASSPASLNS